jgi:hypothetical protein
MLTAYGRQQLSPSPSASPVLASHPVKSIQLHYQRSSLDQVTSVQRGQHRCRGRNSTLPSLGQQQNAHNYSQTLHLSTEAISALIKESGSPPHLGLS